MEICLCQQQQAGGKRKKTAVWKIKTTKKKSILIWVTELMKQSFSGVFCFLWKQKRKSRDIKNAMVWILQLWSGWKEDRSLSQRWLVGHSLAENNDALLPWAYLWLLFLSLEVLERKQQERISEPVLQQCAIPPSVLRAGEVHRGYARESGRTATVLLRWCCEPGLCHTLGTKQRKRKPGVLKQLQK